MESNPPPPSMVGRSPEDHDRLLKAVKRLTAQKLPPTDYYGRLLCAVGQFLAVPAGAAWSIDEQGELDLQAEFGRDAVPLNLSEAGKAAHGKLLQAAAAKGQPVVLAMKPPATATAEPTPLILVPILVQGSVAGLLEVWLSANAPVAVQQDVARIVMQVAQLAATYEAAFRQRQAADERRLWAEFEAFARQVHASLHPTEVAYIVANEGRRVVGADRLSVAHRTYRHAEVAAVSGAAVVETRSNLIRCLAALCDAVLDWKEQLVYTGARDDSLPPAVLKTLDAYLDESNSKLLIVVPVRDVREQDESKPCRSVLALECFEPSQDADTLVERLETVGRHASSALYNALEYDQIPLAWLWQPLVKLQRGLGGKGRGIVYGSTAAVVLLVAALVLIPVPLKMEATGQLLPRSRAWVFPSAPGHVVHFSVEPGAKVQKGQNVVLLHDMDLELRLVNLTQEVEAADREIQAAAARAESARGNEAERRNIGIERRKQEAIRDLKMQERDRLRALTNAEESRPGNFWLKAPRNGTVLNFDFQEQLTGKFVRPADPLLRLGDQGGAWEVELKVPQKYIGQVLQAFQGSGQELDVDLLLLSAPTHSYQGKLTRDKIAGEASSRPDSGAATEPVVPLLLRIDGDDIPESRRLPRKLFVSGTEVHARIRCGNCALGYMLFYGLWDFICEKLFYYL